LTQEVFDILFVLFYFFTTFAPAAVLEDSLVSLVLAVLSRGNSARSKMVTSTNATKESYPLLVDSCTLMESAYHKHPNLVAPSLNKVGFSFFIVSFTHPCCKREQKR
jgi:hypothetical protein